MKNLIVILMVLMATAVNAQSTLTLNGGGSVEIHSRAFLKTIGFVFGESPSMNLNIFGDLSFKKNGLSAYYSGFATFAGRSENHIIDLIASHQISKKITLAAGPEVSLSFVGENHEKVIGMTFMASCEFNSNVSSAVMLYSDKYGEYFIGSLEINPSKSIKLNHLLAYTNAEDSKVYGMLGGEYTISNNLFINLNVLIKKSSQIIFGTGVKF